jgi:hypothetical protein
MHIFGILDKKINQLKNANNKKNTTHNKERGKKQVKEKYNSVQYWSSEENEFTFLIEFILC